MRTSEYERFLEAQKEKFCNYHCRANKLNIINRDNYVTDFDCEYCGKENSDIEQFETEFNICDHCVIDRFIKDLVWNIEDLPK